MPSTGNSAAENDCIATDRDIHVADMILAIDFPVYNVDNPFAAQETELGEPVFSLSVLSRVVMYMIPSVLDRNANTVMLVTLFMVIGGCSYRSISLAQEGTGQRPSISRRTRRYATRESFVKMVLRSSRVGMPSGLRSGVASARLSASRSRSGSIWRTTRSK